MRESSFHDAIADVSRAPPHLRFAVYRNNVAAALINALRVRYPVVESLVGPAPFAAMTQDYIAGNRPGSPVLIDYGCSYPDFIAAAPLARQMPYLADVARLESLWWTAYHGAEDVPVEPQRFAGFTPEQLGHMRFGFHSSAAMLDSRWAVGSIWEAARRGAGIDDVDIWRPQSILIWRPQAEVQVHVIDPATRSFLAALQAGVPLAEAVEAATADFDLPSQLRMLIASRLVTRIDTGERP
jgi:hypothetical protein